MIRWQLKIGDINQLDIENEIGLGGNAGVGRIGAGTSARAVRQFPRDEETALAADLHSLKALIESRNNAAETLRKADGLRIAELGFAILAEHRLAVLVLEGLTVILGRIELAAVAREPSGVEHLVDLVWLGGGAGANRQVLIAKREGGFDWAASAGHARRKLDGT